MTKTVSQPLYLGSWIAIASFLLTAIGCGDGPRLVSVKGTVTIGGSEPFANGTIRFTPKESAKQLVGASAKTDDDGKYQLMHFSQRKGAQPGDYNVSFSLIKLPDGSPLPDQEGEMEKKSPLELGGTEFVPTEYANFNSSKNPTKVPSAGGTFDFDIPALKPVKKPGDAPASEPGRRRRNEY